MESTLLCPRCGAEYYAHVKTCPDCKIELVDNLEDIPEAGAIDETSAELIATGPVSNLKTLVSLLELHRIPHQVKMVEQGHQIELTPGTEFGLYISSDDAEKVAELVKERALEEYPELREAQESLDSGKCPACGFEAGDAKECPECGLPLWFEEEGDDTSEDA